jgi:hypothetical protein
MGCGASKKKDDGNAAASKQSAGGGEHASSTGKTTVTSKKAKPPSKTQTLGSEEDAATVAGRVPAGSKWTDDAFPPSELSLQLEDKVDGIMWVRPEALCEKPALITGGYEAGDVVQGALGSCWFLGAISVMATRPDLLQIVIPGDEHAAKGVIAFRFYKFGRWLEVVIDDFVPAKSNGPVFASAKDPNELWPTYIEKAYAKLHGSFQAIVGGWVSDALVDLTGGVPDVIYFDEEEVQEQIKSGHLFDRLLQMFQSEEYLLGCAMSTSGTREADTGLGILQGHAYGILEVRRYGKLRMLRCRNPWGCTEWTGKYSDGDKFWTPAMLKEFGHSLGDDGSFWIEYSDFVVQYNKIYVCRLLDDDLYRRVAFMSKWTKGVNAGGCINNRESWPTNPQYKLVVPKKAEIILSIQQPDPRMSTSGEGVYLGLVVFAAPDGAKTTVYRPVHQTKIANVRELTITKTLEPGTYNLMPFTFDKDDESPFVVTAWSTAEIGLTSHQEGEVPLDGSAPPPSGPPPAMDPSIAAAAAAGSGGGTPSAGKTTYQPDDNGSVSAMAKKYAAALGQRYPAFAKHVNPELVAKYVGSAEKMIKGGLKSLFG